MSAWYINSKINIKLLGAEERAIVQHSKSHRTVNEINKLSSLIFKEFNRGDSINEDFQIFLSCTSVNYLDVINLYKIISSSLMPIAVLPLFPP